MSMTRREQLTEHLRFFEELGVDGVSRDPTWRRRAATEPESAVPESPVTHTRVARVGPAVPGAGDVVKWKSV